MSLSDADILREFNRRFAPKALAFPKTFEELFTHDECFALTTATPVQRAFCRVIDRAPLKDLWDDPLVREAFAHVSPDGGKFRELMILAAIRTAKSLIGGALAMWCSQKVQIKGMGVRRTEIPRFSMVSLEKDNANVTFTHLAGAIKSPRLQHLFIREPPAEWTDEMDILKDGFVTNCFLAHPDGWPIEVRAVVGKRAGGSLVSRYSAGVVFSEAPRMVGALDGVVNYTDMRKAVLGRMLPGAWMLSEGSPWKSYGPVYDIQKNERGINPRPTKNRCIVKSTGPACNPTYWTPERCAELKTSDPEAYRTDVEGEFADADEGLVTATAVQECVRREPYEFPPEPRHDYIAIMDPASSSNAWTFGIMDRVGNVRRLVRHGQFKPVPGTPLRPRAVMKEISEILHGTKNEETGQYEGGYGIHWIYTDQYAAEAIRDIAEEFGIAIAVVNWTGQEKTEIHLHLAALINGTQLSLPNDPLIHKDLVLTTKRPGTKSVLIHYSETPDGRHCDYVPILAIGVRHYQPDVQKAPPEKGTSEHWAEVERQMIARETEALQIEIEAGRVTPFPGGPQWLD